MEAATKNPDKVRAKFLTDKVEEKGRWRLYAVLSAVFAAATSILAKIGIDPIHMINTSGAVILGMVYNFLPYMIMPVYSVMAKLDRSMIEACQDLGGSRLTVIRRCIIPMSMPGIVSGITMVFVPSVSTFYISQKLGGGTFALIGDVIEMQFQVSNNFNFGAALSLVLMVLILICMAFMNKFSSTEDAGGRLVL